MGMFDWLMPQQGQAQTGGVLGPSDPSQNQYLDAMTRGMPSSGQPNMALLGFGMGMMSPDARGNGIPNAMQGMMSGAAADANNGMKQLQMEKARRGLLSVQAYAREQELAGKPMPRELLAALMANPESLGKIAESRLIPQFQAVDPGKPYGAFVDGKWTQQGQVPFKPEIRTSVNPATGAESEEYVSLPLDLPPGETRPVGGPPAAPYGGSAVPNGLSGPAFGQNGMRAWGDQQTAAPQQRITKLGPGQIAALTKEGTDTGEAGANFESIKSKMPGLVTVVSELDDLSNKATYTMAGKAINWASKEAAMAPREAAIARTKYIAMVDNQILPLLRDTFGAQFTRQEGESLKVTLGDPDKTPEEKQAVLRAFIEQKQRNVMEAAQRVGRSYEPIPMPDIGKKKDQASNIPAPKDRKIGEFYVTPDKKRRMWTSQGWAEGM